MYLIYIRHIQCNRGGRGGTTIKAGEVFLPNFLSVFSFPLRLPFSSSPFPPAAPIVNSYFVYISCGKLSSKGTGQKLEVICL